MDHPVGVDGALDRLVYRPDIGAMRWRHPGVVRRIYAPGVAQALAATEPGDRVLDVGCGLGSVARALALAGRDVLAIDGDPDAIAGAEITLAGSTGQARVAEFGPGGGLEPGSFDAIRFGRVLHHIPDLAAAVDHAAALLAPGGVLIVEEFGPERFEERLATWVAAQAAALVAEDIAIEGPPIDATELAEAWHARIGQMHLHPVGAVVDALSVRFALGPERWEGGIWADLGKRLVDSDTATAVADRLAAAEEEAIAAGEIPAVVLRVEGVVREVER